MRQILLRREDVNGASQGGIDDVRLGLTRATTATSEPIFVADETGTATRGAMMPNCFPWHATVGDTAGTAVAG
jgi:hypothetical protein